MLSSLKKKLRRARFKLGLSRTRQFGHYDVYFGGYYRGTVLAFGPAHAIEQRAQDAAYLRDAEGHAIAHNPQWSSKLNSVPMSPAARERTEPFKPRHLLLQT